MKLQIHVCRVYACYNRHTWLGRQFVLSSFVLEEVAYHGSWACLKIILGAKTEMLWLLFALYPDCSPGWYSQQVTLRTEITPPPGQEHVHFESHRLPKLIFLAITQIHMHSVHLNPTPPPSQCLGHQTDNNPDLFSFATVASSKHENLRRGNCNVLLTLYCGY